MTGWSDSGSLGRWSSLTMGSVRRRRIVLAILLTVIAVGIALIAFAPVAAAFLTAVSVAVLGIDLVLLRQRQVGVADRSMEAAFRSRRPRRNRPPR